MDYLERERRHTPVVTNIDDCPGKDLLGTMAETEDACGGCEHLLPFFDQALFMEQILGRVGWPVVTAAVSGTGDVRGDLLEVEYIRGGHPHRQAVDAAQGGMDDRGIIAHYRSLAQMAHAHARRMIHRSDVKRCHEHGWATPETIAGSFFAHIWARVSKIGRSHARRD